MTMLMSHIFFFGFGVVAGLCFFTALHRSLQLIFEGEKLAQVCALYVFRFFLAGAVLFLAARNGVLDLALAVLGLTLARFLGARKWSL